MSCGIAEVYLPCSFSLVRITGDSTLRRLGCLHLAEDERFTPTPMAFFEKKKRGSDRPTKAMRRSTDQPGKDEANPLPALRSVSAEMISLNAEKRGQPDPEESGMVLHDPDHFAANPVVLTHSAFAIAVLFDGQRTAEDVAAEFKALYGQEVDLKNIEKLAEELDGSLFLDSPRFREEVRKLLLLYLSTPVRPAAHADLSYPSDPEKLREQVATFFTSQDGPGLLPDRPVASSDTVRGLILPHIDLRVGGATYAHGYKALLEQSQADLIVVLGVAHRAPSSGTFFVSAKDFATPVGPVRTQRGIAQRLQAVAGVDTAVAEYAHKEEHSVEFQAVLLATLLQEKAGRELEMVPILCGSPDPYFEQKKNPAHAEDFVRFADALRNELEKSKRRWCIMASVDLSHVGPKFGHATNITEKVLLPVERADRKMLAKLELLDPDAFYGEFTRTEPPNSRHVDAVMPVLLMLTVGRGLFKQTRLLHYDQMLEPPTKSAVTFATMAFDQ